jgi:pimeloyl-ACP methyl ester carboxylesterase
MVVGLLITPILFGQKVSEPFEFQFENKTLRGVIEKPQDRPSTAIVIIIPGYGRTDFVEGGWFTTLRNKFVEAGLTVCCWDRMGCGKSEGVFDAGQPVKNSADEAVAAIQEIKRRKIPGADRIGLWGISRAGWICPLINEQYPIAFWISVSGTDDKENFGYLLKSNLLIAGKSEDEAERLYRAWMLGHKLFCTHGSYEDRQEAIRPLIQDSTSRRLFGYSLEPKNLQEARASYVKDVALYTSNGYFDQESGLWVYIKDLDTLLEKMRCPVLAIFGENDSQVDWRTTKKLYEGTIGSDPHAELTIKTFVHCGHGLQKCVTCGFKEDLSASNWEACDGYYETMIQWLSTHGITTE